MTSNSTGSGKVRRTGPTLYGREIPEEAAAVVKSPAGIAYRGKAGCKNWTCSQDGNPDRCYGWHCLDCDGPSNCQGECSNPECPRRQSDEG